MEYKRIAIVLNSYWRDMNIFCRLLHCELKWANEAMWVYYLALGVAHTISRLTSLFNSCTYTKIWTRLAFFILFFWFLCEIVRLCTKFLIEKVIVLSTFFPMLLLCINSFELWRTLKIDYSSDLIRDWFQRA